MRVEDSLMKGELTKWQVEKMVGLFDLLDNDGDHTIDETDLDFVMERLLLFTEWPENSRVFARVLARWKTLLETLFADSLLLTEQKWVEQISGYLKKESDRHSKDANYSGIIEEIGDLLFLILDRDRDKKIGYEDFLLFFDAIGQNERDAEECFEKIDSDEDGSIPKTEFIELLRDFFQGDSAGEPSDWMFGVPPNSTD